MDNNKFREIYGFVLIFFKPSRLAVVDVFVIQIQPYMNEMKSELESNPNSCLHNFTYLYTPSTTFKHNLKKYWVVFALDMRFSLCVSDETYKVKLCHENVLRRIINLIYNILLHYNNYVFLYYF